MEKKVLTQEEIKQLKDIQDLRNNLIENFGLLEINYETQKQILTNKLQELIKKEEFIGNQLQQKYGDGSIDLDKGEFTSN